MGTLKILGKLLFLFAKNEKKCFKQIQDMESELVEAQIFPSTPWKTGCRLPQLSAPVHLLHQHAWKTQIDFMGGNSAAVQPAGRGTREK